MDLHRGSGGPATYIFVRRAEDLLTRRAAVSIVYVADGKFDIPPWRTLQGIHILSR